MALPNNIRSRLFIGFSILILLIVINQLISHKFLTEQSRISAEEEKLQKIETRMLDLSISQLFFIENNFMDTSLYIKVEKYQPLIKQYEKYKELKGQIGRLSNNGNLSKDGRLPFNDLIKAIDDNQEIFVDIISLQIEKGFKDWGHIGKMRYFAHQLEDQAMVPITTLLSMRRHEKDYLLRKDIKYLDKLIIIVKGLQEKCNGKGCIYLNGYVEKFRAVVENDEKIGDFYNKGLKSQLLKKIEKTTEDFDKLLNNYSVEQKKITSNIRWLSFISGTLITIIALIISISVSRNISKPLKALISDMKDIVKSNNSFHLNSYKGRPYNEILDLISAFNSLMNKINTQITNIKEKSARLELQNEELMKVNKELDYFVYSSSHDLRSPLSSLLGLISITKMEKDLEVRDNYLDKMESMVKRLDKFTSDILDHSKNSRTSEVCDKVDIGSIVKEIFEDIGIEGDMYPVKREFLMNGMEVIFYSDSKRIGIILKNLIYNAVKYADSFKKDPYVKVNLSVDDEKAFFRITDNGIGIAKEHQPKIFEMFYRGTDSKQGSGIGLYIVKETVERLGGTIKFESKIGEGTTFGIFLPNRIKEQQEVVGRKDKQLGQGSKRVIL